MNIFADLSLSKEAKMGDWVVWGFGCTVVRPVPPQSSGVAGYSILILILFMQVFFILRKCESK
jgi:hypothetical protein